MAVELAHAYVTIVPSLKGIQDKIKEQIAPVTPTLRESFAKGISEGLSTLGGKIQSIGGNLSSIGSQLNSKITMPIVGATAAAGGLVAALGWKRLVSIDSARAQLKGLGYDAEDVERISDNLREAITGGMLTMGEATSAAAAALGAGVEEGKELTRYIKLLDSAVVGSNGTFDEMSQIFARVQAQGKLTRDELYMIEHRMPGFSSAVQEALGVTTEEMYNMLSAGEITTEQFLDVMEDFAGGMSEAVAESWSGMVDNTKANIAIIGEALLSGVFEESKESIAEFLEYLRSDDVKTWAAETGEAIGSAFSNMLDSIRSAIDWWNGLDDSQKKMIGTFATVLVAIGPVLSIVGRLASGIGTLVSVAGSIVGVFGGGSAAATALGGAVRFLLGPWGLLIGAVAALIASSPELQGLLMEIATTIGGALMGVLEAVAPLFDELVKALTPLVEEVLSQLGGLLSETVIPLITELLNAILPLISSLVELVLPVFMLWFELIMQQVEVAIPPLIAIIGVLFDIVETVFNALGPIIEAALTVVQGIIDTVVGVLTGDWSRAWDGIKSIFSGVWDLIKAIVTGAIDVVKSVITGGLDLIQGLWDSVWGAVSGFFSDIWGDIVDAATGFFNSVSDKFTELTDYVGEIPDKIMEFFSGIGDWLVDSGKALLDGFIEGITAGFDKAKGWVTDKLGDLRDLFPFSPAKEGPFSGRGWVEYSGVSMGETFMRSIADSLHDGKGDVVDELEAINSEFDTFRDQSADFEIGLSSPSGAPHLSDGAPMVVHGPLVSLENLTVDSEDRVQELAQELWTRAARADRARGHVSLAGATR